MIRFVEYEPEHLFAVELQPLQRLWRDTLVVQPGYAQSLAIQGMSWSGLIGDRVVGCAGLAPRWEGNVIAWGLFSDTIPQFAWTAIVRKMQRELHEALKHAPHRVELTTPGYHDAARRLARMLGFEAEGRLRRYGPDGADHYMYSQITKGDRLCVH